MLERFRQCEGFERDEHNTLKNWTKHGVAPGEAEPVFFNQPLVASEDEKHSASEPRYCVLGQTNAGRLLFVAFTIRSRRIRVVSARDMNRKEREVLRSA